MEHKKSHFVGATGTYYVMSKLSYECIHASATFGNAPYIDIVASSEKGDRQIAIQVKTADFARRGGNERNGWAFKSLDWPLSYKAATLGLDNLFFVFVDLGGERMTEEDWKSGHRQPTTYIVPSKALSNEICKYWTEGAWRLQVDIAVMDPYKENWELLKTALSYPSGENVATLDEE